jgi:hypothetical protein
MTPDPALEPVRQQMYFFWTRIQAGSKVKSMIKTKDKWDHILWNETFGFSLLVVLSWLSELLRIPHYLSGEPFVPNWHRAILRSVVILLIWSWVHLLTKRILKRLHYLEEFIRVCGWCRRVCYQDQWMPMEKYLNTKYDMHTTHGVCPDCLKDTKEEIKQLAHPPAHSDFLK